ncbi:hypothetical protein BV20DRAFT_978172 [Pilatotrama ljubarskyi]|nr:hypothetical protein BV20DRAFT_978172 [Pilatotrama ljubarskyi]
MYNAYCITMPVNTLRHLFPTTLIICIPSSTKIYGMSRKSEVEFVTICASLLGHVHARNEDIFDYSLLLLELCTFESMLPVPSQQGQIHGKPANSEQLNHNQEQEGDTSSVLEGVQQLMLTSA